MRTVSDLKDDMLLVRYVLQRLKVSIAAPVPQHCCASLAAVFPFVLAVI